MKGKYVYCLKTTGSLGKQTDDENRSRDDTLFYDHAAGALSNTTEFCRD